MKTALITGITGQDGSYLAEFLLEKGYKVVGLARRSSSSNLSRISHLFESDKYKDRFSIVEGDLTDSSSLKCAVEVADPTEVYNLAAMSHVQTSFQIPEYTANVDALGTLRIIEAVKEFNPNIRFYQASTSELFGKVKEIPQNESTPFHPRSPYGVAKIYGYWAVVNYREAYKLFACNGILFNHESPRRGENFVSRKITLGVARIKYGLQHKISLGNLDAKRDWGYAKDFIEGMWLMLQQKEPQDYVLATGVTNTVRKFVELSFKEIEREIVWSGDGVNEKGYDKQTGDVLVDISSEFFRPSEVDLLIGDPSKARNELGWSATTTVEELVSLMVSSDLQHVLMTDKKMHGSKQASPIAS
jgi:GDPmannose 4,6-dehydratase